MGMHHEEAARATRTVAVRATREAAGAGEGAGVATVCMQG